MLGVGKFTNDLRNGKQTGLSKGRGQPQRCLRTKVRYVKVGPVGEGLEQPNLFLNLII